MISRVADHCFWLGRYIERAESTARVLFVTRNLALDAELSPRQCWQPVVIVAGEGPRFAARFGEDAAGDGELVQRYMTWDEQNPVSIKTSISAARENSRSIREVVSLETWETVNELHLWLKSPEAQVNYEHHRYTYYRHVRHGAQLILGFLRSTMLHDTPLDFIWLGVLLERAGQTARILDVHHHALTALDAHREVQTSLWLSLLRACSGFEPYMKTSQGRVSRAGVAEFLILEQRFPRSLRYCVRSAYERLAAIRPPANAALPGGGALERLRVLDAWMAEQKPGAFDPDAIHQVLTHIVDEISAVGDEVGRELLGYAPPAAAVENTPQ